ncbi:alpha-N-acetylglucosaminidase [Nonomuraea turkmeniaca]|uniref:Alpha-N-acetylglucosaminidase n=1 Tax=Nonomuraea turkmeniaca TaxID=103838 RepID=A0A5S4FKA4_9ACTN|nr:alpha-N-acetylglucosaminidase [Nonomuraea turkmeniaca]TMR09528.1 alpha-N-acetylglucosaminidase [Nonomuraea turkmeniaca]
MLPGDGEHTPLWADTVRGLAHRVLGSVAESVRFASSAASDGARGAGRAYAYEAKGGVLTVAATDGVGASVGLHHYLREHCGRSVGWDTPLPLGLTSLPDAPLHQGAARVREGYYFNFCTFSYTMPYWNWADWEREIDWMALHGITMPLAVTGHEAALHAAYTLLGLDDDRIRGFLGGPGYLPFQFMGCLDDFAGPLSSSWIDGHRELGARILDRERAFGMTPVLPAFTGHVPREIASAARAGRRQWQGFETWVLDPADPLYARIGAEITRAQIKLFGTDHLYAADPFIEMIPIDADPAFPGAVAAATLAGLRAADSEAVWLMQAWPFSYQREFWTEDRVTTFLDAIPGDRMLVADLWAEHDPLWGQFDGFSGKPWLWCSLLNFGGRTDPVADLRGVPAGIEAALAAPRPPTGIGLSMEATRNNPVFFELAADQIWNRVPDLDAWLDAYVAQRYEGRRTAELRAAWRGLLDTVYSAQSLRAAPDQFKGVLLTNPSYTRTPDISRALWYEPSVLAQAWERMIAVAEQEPGLVAGPLGHDLVETGIAYMARVADRRYLEVVESAGGPEAVARFLRVFEDLDRMLACRPEYTFQRWEAKAVSWAAGPGDRAVLQDNARRILTVWGTSDSPLLDDYAGRHWAGLVGGYYRDRWELWARDLGRALAGDVGAEAELRERLRDRAETFLREGAAPVVPGDLAAESRRLHTAYAGVLEDER